MIPRNNTSGRKGASWNSRDRCWYGTIKVNKRSVHLGKFESRDAAADAYDAAAIRFHGAFAAPNHSLLKDVEKEAAAA